MDKNLKGSLLFGLIAGGLFAAARNASQKKNLTDGQLKDLNALRDLFTQLQNTLADNIGFTSIYGFIKEKGAKKNYGEIIAYLENQIQGSHAQLSTTDENFQNKLEYVLSDRFTADRANAKTHEVQSKFALLKQFPSAVEALLNKRLEILELMRKTFGYIKAGEAEDFKPEDAAMLQSLVGQFKALESRVSETLTQFNLWPGK